MYQTVHTRGRLPTSSTYRRRALRLYKTIHLGANGVYYNSYYVCLVPQRQQTSRNVATREGC